MFIERQCTILHGIKALEGDDALHEKADHVVHVCRAWSFIVPLEAIILPLIWPLGLFDELPRCIVRLVNRVEHVARDCVREVSASIAARPAVDVVDSFAYTVNCHEWGFTSPSLRLQLAGSSNDSKNADPSDMPSFMGMKTQAA